MRRPWLRFVFSAWVITVCSFGAPTRCVAKTVWLVWDANPKEENVVGYRVYFGPVRREGNPSFSGYSSEQDVGNATTWPIEISDARKDYYAAVVAYNGYGLQSDYSEEVTISSSTPGGGDSSSGGGGGGGGGCFVRTAAGGPRGLAAAFISAEALLVLATALCLVFPFRQRLC